MNLPFLKKIKIGQIEIEREIAETKKNLDDFKQEVRNNFSIISTNINTIGNLSNTTNIYLSDINDIKHQLKEKGKDKATTDEAAQIKQEVSVDEDYQMALVRTRIKIEARLRELLDKKLTRWADKEIKYLSLNSLIKLFLSEYPDYKFLAQSLDFTRRITNGAVHSQSIPEGEAKEALDIGVKTMAILNNIID